MDVAPWCCKWMGWMGLDGSPDGVRYRGEVRYRAPSGANDKWAIDIFKNLYQFLVQKLIC